MRTSSDVRFLLKCTKLYKKYVDLGFYILYNTLIFGGAAMIGGIAPDCKSGTLKRSWFESNRPHQV